MSDQKNKEQEIRAAVDAEVKAEQAELEAAAAAEAKEEGKPTPKFIYDCLMANEMGDGTLFAFLHKETYLYNRTSDEWLTWTGHHWTLDDGEHIYAAVNAVAMVYLDEAFNLDKKIADARTKKKKDRADRLEKRKASYLARAKKLRSTKGARECISWARRIEEGGLDIKGSKLDCQPWLLACRNGVLELKTGRFRPGRPDDYLSRAVPHDWPDTGIDTEAPNWDGFFTAVFGANTELINFTRRLGGYMLTGLSTEHILPVFIGEGRNGKGTLVETLSYVLGALAQPIQSEMLLDQRGGRASSGPSPDIMGLKALRIAFASETDENRRFSPSKVKWLSGGDTLRGRNPHDKYETVFEPTHTLCLLTNHLPHAPGDDYAFWQRIRLIPFKKKFVDNPAENSDTELPRDKNLLEKLKAEAPAILAWLVRGNIEWQQQGLNPPPAVLSETEKARFSEDFVSQFLEACCHPKEETADHAKEKLKEVYQAFIDWYSDTIGDSKYAPKKSKFIAAMKKHYTYEKSSGDMCFFGVKLLSDNTDWVD